MIGVERGIASDVNLPFSSFYQQSPIGGGRSSASSIQASENEEAVQRESSSSGTSEPNLVINKPIIKSIIVKNPHHDRDITYRIVVRSACNLPATGN
jgi:hypothetical protein